MVTRKIGRASSVLAVVLPALLLAAAVAAQPSEPTTPEEMRHEIQKLRAQVQALRSAITDALEYDRLRMNTLNRAMGTGPNDAPAPREKAVEAPVRAATGRSSAAPRHAQAPAVEPSGTIHGRVEVPSGEPVAYVFVENVRGPAVKGQKVKIEQVSKSFVPSWAVVQKGTVVEFPNMDNIYHNVFSVSPGNTFDLGLYNSSESKTYSFEDAGAVDIYCNIHPQMAASVLVVPNRFFTKVKADGSFELADVPGGKRKVVAWSPGSRLSAEWVEVNPGASSAVNLTLERKVAGHKNKLGRPYGSYE
jgi:plastocyanin